MIVQNTNNKSLIEDIYNRIEDILVNSKNEPLNLLGSYIIGCTFVLDDIHEYYDKYPILDEIVGLSAELEATDDISMQEQIIHEIKSKLADLSAILTANKKS